jgi:hypothetical protein
VLPRPRANNSQQSRGGILLTDFVASFYGTAGLQRRIGGESGARQRPEARDIAKMKREEKEWRELMEKRRGTTAIYLPGDRNWRLATIGMVLESQ